MLSHNIANSNSNGFKSENIAFQSVLASEEQQYPGSRSTPFSSISKKSYDLSEGAFVTTDNPLDVAIQGDGFFEVDRNGQRVYTRNGAFSISPNGQLVTANGDTVIGDTGVIQLNNSGPIQIAKTGQITINGEEVGRLRIVRFPDPSSLTSVGGTYYQIGNGAEVVATDNVSVLQGTIEQSNTNVVLSLVQLIEVSRQHGAYSRVIQNLNRLDSQTMDDLARIS